MNCPICKKKAEPMDKNKSYPFCCKRCKQIDLGNWCSDEYKIEDENQSTDDSFENE